MTNDYKENLMKWLTGNFTPTPANDRFTQEGTTENENILYNYLSENYTTTNCYVIKNVKSTVNGNLLSLLYDNDNDRSIIIIFDGELNPIKLITSYSSGTQFKHIMNINVGEDGNFFLIENTGSNIRFVMCNNITASDVNGDYKVVLRKAYNVGGNLINLVDVYAIVKYPNLSKYLVIGTDDDMTRIMNIATEIVINVGAENEYNDFTFSGTIYAKNYLDIYYTLDGENIKFCIAAAGNSDQYSYCELKNSNYTISETTYGGISPTIKAVKTSYNEAYIVEYDWETTYNFYHFNNGTFTLIGSYITDGGGFNARTQAYTIGKINNVIYGIVLGDYDSNNYQIRGFTIIDDVLQTSGLSEGVGHEVFYYNMLMTATNNYDLYNFAYIFGNLTTRAYLVYNESRYNGYGYIDYNYFVPSYARIINNGLTFARGLYNFTILGNSSMATVNIPNSYVNDVEFSAWLYGETNKDLIRGGTFEKNIYENVLVNFNNSITITNDNMYMSTPSVRLNNSILNQLDYDNAKLGWVRINYANSTKDIPITLTQNNIYSYTASFVIMAGEDINNIQLLSNDKQTIYDQFNIEYQIGNIYKIERDINIGG